MVGMLKGSDGWPRERARVLRVQTLWAPYAYMFYPALHKSVLNPEGRTGVRLPPMQIKSLKRTCPAMVLNH